MCVSLLESACDIQKYLFNHKNGEECYKHERVLTKSNHKLLHSQVAPNL